METEGSGSLRPVSCSINLITKTFNVRHFETLLAESEKPSAENPSFSRLKPISPKFHIVVIKLCIQNIRFPSILIMHNCRKLIDVKNSFYQNFSKFFLKFFRSRRDRGTLRRNLSLLSRVATLSIYNGSKRCCRCVVCLNSRPCKYAAMYNSRNISARRRVCFASMSSRAPQTPDRVRKHVASSCGA